MLNKTYGKPLRGPIVYHTYRGSFALRSGPWVYIDAKSGDAKNQEPQWFRNQRRVVPHNEQAELFNLEEDPQQTRNVCTKYPEKTRELKKLLGQMKKQSRSVPERL